MRFARRNVPETNGLVVGARGDGAAVGRPGEDVDAGEMAGESLEVGKRWSGRVDVYCGVGSSGGEEFTRRGEADAGYAAGVAAEGTVQNGFEFEVFRRGWRRSRCQGWLRAARKGVGAGGSRAWGTLITGSVVSVWVSSSRDGICLP